MDISSIALSASIDGYRPPWDTRRLFAHCPKSRDDNSDNEPFHTSCDTLSEVPSSRRGRPRPRPDNTVLAALKPLIPVVVRPVVEPVVERLDRHEELLLELKASLDVQFQRIAAIQAQIDTLLAEHRRKP